MKKVAKFMVMASLFAFCGSLSASDGLWTNLTTGVWNDATQWKDGVIAGGTKAEAQIAPGYGVSRPDDRWLQVPDDGVTVGKILYQDGVPIEGDNIGAIRIWGGHINFDNGEYPGYLTDFNGGSALILLTTLECEGDIQFSNAILAGKSNHKGNTDVHNLLMYGHCYAAEPNVWATTNFLPATSLLLNGNLSIYSHGGWGEFKAQFTLTKGSRLIVCTEALDKGIGALMTGEGIAEGTYMEASITEFAKALNQPATESGTFELTVQASPYGTTSLQQFKEIDVQSGGSMDIVNHNGGAQRVEANELKGSGDFYKSNWGTLSLNVVTNFTGTFYLNLGGVTFDPPEGVVDSLNKFCGPFISSTGINTATVNIPDEEDVLHVGAYYGQGNLTKTGEGTLKIDRMSCVNLNQLEVQEGRVELGKDDNSISTLPIAAWFHVDASCADSFTTVQENGTNYITQWNDADGGGVFAYCDANDRAVRPWISTNYFGGKAVVDFGSLYYKDNNNYHDGYGASLVWNQNCNNVREVFLVYSDTDDIAELPENLCGNFILGQTWVYDFHRNLNQALFHPDYCSSGIKNGLIELDGENASCDTVLLGGFHLIHLRTTGIEGQYVNANAFAQNRKLGYGGQRIAEAVIYNRELNDSEATLVSNYLNQKWFGAMPTANISNLVISGDAEINIDKGEPFGVSKLTIDGHVVKKGEGALVADELEIKGDGELTIESGTFQSGTNQTIVLPNIDVSNGAGVGAYSNGILKVQNVTGSGKLVKEGEGTVTVRHLESTVTEVDVKDGTLEMKSGIMPSGAWFHVDASVAEKFTTVTEGDKTYVTQWRDCDGGNIAANAVTRPYLNTNAIPGKTVVDFGSYHYPNNGGGDTVNGYGGYMQWSATDTEIREVFLVYSDSEDIKDCPSGLTPNFFLGDTDLYQFHRGLYRQLFISFTADNIKNGLIEVDEESRTIDYALPSGFHLIHLRTTGNVRANAFAQNRWLGFGGQLIAEAAIYNRVLSNEEALSASSYLIAKWWGSGDVNHLGNVVIEGGSCLDCSNVDLTIDELLCFGELKAKTLHVGNWKLASNGDTIEHMSFTGDFDASPVGCVTVDGIELEKEPGSQYVIVAGVKCKNAELLNNWSVRGTAIPPGWSGKLKMVDGNLVLILNAAGTSIFIR